MSRHHMCVDIKGALLNWTDRQNVGVWRGDDGKVLSPWAVKRNLIEALAKGYKYLPVGDCEGFDFQTGCPGHERTEESSCV